MNYSFPQVVEMLSLPPTEAESLFAEAHRVRCETAGDGIFLRGLIEYSNVCRKNCLYCGIRRDNIAVDRYTLSAQQVVSAARSAFDQGYGSIVIQAGELVSKSHVADIEGILQQITALSNGVLGITLSLGEQTADTYKRWFEAGAHRYLLRIESSDRRLYESIHPNDGHHGYDRRIEALHHLREAGYQVGTGVMIGLPGQNIEHLAGDLLFMKEFDIDMCGMGPYIECENTPLSQVASGQFADKIQRIDMTLKMIATLRMMMPDINIAATTALQAIEPSARQRALECGANVIMPNISPMEYRANYRLYNDKPMVLDSRILENNIRYGERGDSPHFGKR